jgi:ribosomal protein L16 Arg81 hydroxylase
VLHEWLGALTVDEFRATHFRRRAVARAGTTLAARGLLDWSVLGRVLASDIPARDVLVVARGRLLAVPVPRSLAELRVLMQRGIGLCVQHGERHDAGLARVAAAFAADGDVAQTQLFVTPGGTHGFGWHYDDEDVYIAQTAGTKDYYFRANTVAADLPAAPATFARFGAETSPVATATIAPGDFLYVPARWWHMAVCRSDALSISVGVSSKTRASTLRAAQ